MKITKSHLKKIVRNVIREQLADASAIATGPSTYQNSYDTDPNDPYGTIRQIFQYIEEYLQDGQYSMAKKFTDSLNNEIDKLERRSYGFNISMKQEQNQVQMPQPRQGQQAQQAGQQTQQQPAQQQRQQEQEPVSQQQQLMQQIDQSLKSISGDANKLSNILQYIQQQTKT